MKSKRIISLALAAVTAASCLSMGAFAADPVRGDLNGDSRVTAADARIALRISAKLETPTAEQLTAGDINGDGNITAAEARQILRVSAHLDTFPAEPTTEPTTAEPTTAEPTTAEPTTLAPTTEAPTEPVETTTDSAVQVDTYPAAITAFFSGEFYLDGEMTSSGDSSTVLIATNGRAYEVGMNMSGIAMRLMAANGKNYLKIISADGKKYYIELTQSIMDNLGMNLDDFTLNLSFGDIDDFGKPTKSQGEYNGTACDIYSFSKNSESSAVFYAVGEDIIGIEVNDAESGSRVGIAVNELTGEIPSDMLTVNGWQATSILILMQLLGDINF